LLWKRRQRQKIAQLQRCCTRTDLKSQAASPHAYEQQVDELRQKVKQLEEDVEQHYSTLQSANDFLINV
jgi:outer membrane murein-binding lipoprotein Lpp